MSPLGNSQEMREVARQANTPVGMLVSHRGSKLAPRQLMGHCGSPSRPAMAGEKFAVPDWVPRSDLKIFVPPGRRSIGKKPNNDDSVKRGQLTTR